MKISKKTLLEVGAVAGGGVLGLVLKKLLYKGGKPEISIDFDKTITSGNFPHTGHPQKGVKQSLKTLLKDFDVVIWSTRTSDVWKTVIKDFDKEEQATIIKQFMDTHKLPYTRIELVHNKPFSIVVCDNVVNHDGNWEHTIDSIYELSKSKK